MALNPPSDIVLEVARAASPDRAAAVARKLGAPAAGAPTAGADFAAAWETTRAAPPPQVLGASDMRARGAAPAVASNDRASKAQVQFEAVLLNSFVSEMLPKDAPEAFGEGLAGQMWRSLLAEKISNQLAVSGVLGLDRKLFASHPLAATMRAPGASIADHAVPFGGASAS